jgi:hypothetical protein
MKNLFGKIKELFKNKEFVRWFLIILALLIVGILQLTNVI